MVKNTRVERSSRSGSGSFIAESPLAIWILFVLFLIPFLDIASMTVRYTFVLTASRDAAHAASHARTFRTNISGDDLSAQNAALQTAYYTAAQFSGIRVDSVVTRIVITDLDTGVRSISTVPLAQPADTSDNLYELETVVNATINPLVTYATGVLPGVPGLSAPVPVQVVSREFAENPQGLNL